LFFNTKYDIIYVNINHMNKYNNEDLKIFISRNIKMLRPFFICLYLVLFCVQVLQAKTDERITNIKKELINTQWTIYVISKEMVKQELKSEVGIDSLAFTESSVLSKNLSTQGYSKDGSSYKIKIGADGFCIWESIQLHENQKDIVLLKGELKNGVMTGVIVYQQEGGQGRTCNFTTIQPKTP